MSQPHYPYVHVSLPSQDVELISDQLWELGAQGIEERDQSTLLSSPDENVLLVASFPSDELAHQAVAKLRCPARVEYVVGDSWREAWREYFHPQKIGTRLLLRPSWHEVQAEPSEIVLTIDPGAAFGSGLHETTRLMLKEIDARIQGGERVLDVGVGSGILSIAALLLGAKSAQGIDVDPMAVDVALENARLNNVENRFSASTVGLQGIEDTYPLVLANIQTPILVKMAASLMKSVESSGTLILSGILAGQEDDIQSAFKGFCVNAIKEEGQWRAIVMSR